MKILNTLLLFVVLLICTGVAIRTQMMSQPQVAAIPKWEVVSVKPCAPNTPPPIGGRGGGGSGGGSDLGTLNTSCAHLADFIQEAYFIYADGHANFPSRVPVSGAPPWISSEFYQINAKVEGSASNAMMRGPMLQSIIEDRFKLKVHRESKEVPAYALTVAKGGPKLQQSQEGDCVPSRDPRNPPPPALPGQTRPPAWTVIPGGTEKTVCGGEGQFIHGPNLTKDSLGTNLGNFAEILRGILGRPVIDRTGLTGIYNIDLEFFPDDTTPGINLPVFRPGSSMEAYRELHANDPVGPTLLTAIHEQLGLKLESTKGPGEFFVIDHVERPTLN